MFLCTFPSPFSAQVLCGPSPEETLAAGAAKQAANVAASAYYSNKANLESLVYVYRPVFNCFVRKLKHLLFQNHNVELKATSGKVTVSVGGGEATTLISSGCAIPVRRSKHLDKLEDPSLALEAEFFFEREGNKKLLARVRLRNKLRQKVFLVIYRITSDVKLRPFK